MASRPLGGDFVGGKMTVNPEQNAEHSNVEWRSWAKGCRLFSFPKNAPFDDSDSTILSPILGLQHGYCSSEVWA